MSNSFYQQNIQATQLELTTLNKQVNSNSLLRLAVIMIGATALFMLFQTHNVGYVLLCAITVMLIFFYLVFRQAKLERVRDEKLAFLRINENEVAVSTGAKNMYDDGDRFDDGKHAYLSDLDIFGSHSLFEKINRSATQDGVDKLASWLKDPSDRTTISKRQDAVRELAKDPTFNQLLQTKLLFNLGSKVNLRKYLEEYFSGKSMVFGSAFMRIYSFIAPFLIIGGILISIFLYNIMGYVLMLAIAHLLWTMALGGRVSLFSNRIDKVGTTMMAYSGAIRLLEDRHFETDLNIALQHGLKTDNTKLSEALHRLGKLIDKLDVRNNILVGALLNMLMLWDFRQVLAIVDWKKTYEKNTLAAFEVMANYEALLSLAVLSTNQPTWSFPTIMEDPLTDRIVAKDIEHPLIPNAQSVGNDYDAQGHRVALITGSNMAGKSTFLRTVGINAVLAYTGAAAAAKFFSLPIYKLVTYMRIKDNLNESTSTFKAELDRMKYILHVVESCPDSFFLIDEMLRGTNSVDKYLGSKAIIKKLLAMYGKGMVATHDLQLSQLAEQYPSDLTNFHFDIQVMDGEMLFDYKLKDGECKIFNASMLLKGIGVDVDVE